MVARHSFASPFQLLPIRVGRFKTIHVPVADLTGSRPGRTILVTAGLDGDEYAGIEAAYTLGFELSTRQFAGRVIIVPILNVPGFVNETSFNPMDKKFPKYETIGSMLSSPTGRLIRWLVKAYASQSTIWIDLHGAALTEDLVPFDWFHETGYKETDMVSSRILANRKGKTVVYERSRLLGRSVVLARKYGCAFVIVEAGGSVQKRHEDVCYHLDFVRTVMDVLSMRKGVLHRGKPKKIIRHVRVFTNIIHTGVWRSAIAAGNKVNSSGVLGTIYSVDNKVVQVCKASVSGTVLWVKTGMSVRRMDVLGAIGY